MILNLTLQPLSELYRSHGVVDFEEDKQQELRELFVFKKVPNVDEVVDRAYAIAKVAEEQFACMGIDMASTRNCSIRRAGDQLAVFINGEHPWLIEPLIRALRWYRIEPVFAMERMVQEDGKEVMKLGWIEYHVWD